MRSSIACSRCRRSKVKCVNNGVNTTCRACETTGRECTYPVPGGGAVVGTGRSEGAMAGAGGGDVAAGEAPRRPRIRKSAGAIPSSTFQSCDSPRAQVDALDGSLLTSKIWTDLFEIFQLHFSTDLPFLHPPTFLKPLRQVSMHTAQTDFATAPDRIPSTTPAGSPALLLAFLALTARFHPQLVAHHSPPSSTRSSNPLVASEYYAAAAKTRLAGPSGDGIDVPDLDRIQAHLMLALHDWGMCRGAKAWLGLGLAIRSAQLMGMQYEQSLDDSPMARSRALHSEAREMGIHVGTKGAKSMAGASENSIEQEMRRRTFWSCFIMDRYLSSGKYRPPMLNVQDLRIQLPSSERAFLFGESVRTLLLGEESDEVPGRAEVQSHRRASMRMSESSDQPSPNFAKERSASVMSSHANLDVPKDEDKGRWELGLDEGVVSRFIKVVEIYSRIVKWSCRGGRRMEHLPPWDPNSEWHYLERAVANFKDGLPRDLTLTPGNISAHITSRTSTPYTLMHTVIALCDIMLHREYVPFIPIRCDRPQGPLDAPLFPPEKYDIPKGFWERSARQMFKAARDVMDLLRTCQEWGVLAETPIVGFVAYTVAFVGVYSLNFPWMDQEAFMHCQPRFQRGTDQDDDRGGQAARKALEIIGHMRKRLKMADGWFKTIKRSHNYFVRIKKDFARNTKSSPSEGDESDSYRRLSLREGGGGGGLEEYKLLERTLKEFGTLEDEDVEMLDAPGRQRNGQSADEGSESTALTVDLPEGTPDSGAMKSDRWQAINASASGIRTEQAPPGLDGVSNQHSQPAQSTHFQPLNGLPHPSVKQPTAASPLVSPTAQIHPTSPTGYNHAGYAQQTNHGQVYQSLPNPAMENQHHGYGHPSDHAQRAPMSLQQHMQPQLQPPPPPSGPPSQPWTPSMTEMWLSSLNTRMSGDDIAAFVDGNNWEDWAMSSPAVQGGGGWLSAVWGGAGSVG